MNESPIEKLFREATVSAWWPEIPLEQNCRVTVEGARYYIDFAVPSRRFGIELDGHATHSSPTAIAGDRKRQRALERAGWTICRFGGQEVTRNIAAVVWEAKSALSGMIVKGVSDSDRTWFDEHPQAHEHRRPYVPGETPVLFASGARVLVSKTPWGRVRSIAGETISDQPPGATPSMVKATVELAQALAADCAITRNEVLGRPLGTPPDTDHPAWVIPADKALAAERAVFSYVDGVRLVFIPDGPFLEKMERDSGEPLPQGAHRLVRDDGRSVFIFPMPADS